MFSRAATSAGGVARSTDKTSSLPALPALGAFEQVWRQAGVAVTRRVPVVAQPDQRGPGAHEEAAAVLGDDQPALRQQADGLPRGVARGAVPFGQLAFGGQSLARRQLTGLDGTAQLVGDAGARWPGLSAREIADYLGHERVSMTHDVYMARRTAGAAAAAALAELGPPETMG